MVSYGRAPVTAFVVLFLAGIDHILLLKAMICVTVIACIVFCLFDADYLPQHLLLSIDCRCSVVLARERPDHWL